MKLNKLFALAAMAVSSLAASAQMEFMPEGSTLQDAINKAAKENKMVFLDCYTSWCGPCKMMSEKVFPTKEVGDFMNPQFVSIKIDMEKGEGPEIAKRAEISAYPTFIIFDKNGKEINRSVGGGDAENFIARVKECVDKPAGPSLAERFKAGERGRDFLLQYFNDLYKQYRRVQLNDVAELLLEGQAETFAGDTTLVKVFAIGIQNPYSPAFLYAATHPEVMKPVMGEKRYTDKINNVLNTQANNFFVKNADGTMSLDNEEFEKFLGYLKDNNIANPQEYRLRNNLMLAERNGDWKSYADILNTWTTDKTVDMTDYVLASRVMNVVNKCNDPKALKQLRKIVKKRYDDIKSGRRAQQEFTGPRRPIKTTPEMLLETINAIDAKK